MDDLLLASRCPIQDFIVLELKGMLEDWDLVVAPEKIQQQPPWKYLGMTLTETVIRPQKLTIHADNVKTRPKVGGRPSMDSERLWNNQYGFTAPV